MSKDEEIDSLASELDLSVPDAERFIQENHLHGVTWRGTLGMLRTWRKGVHKSQERAKLRAALLRAKQINLVSTLLPGEGD